MANGQGNTIPPWPCFVIAARKEFLEKYPDETWNLLWMIRQVCGRFMDNPNAINIIAERYRIEPADARRWFHKTAWERDVFVSRRILQKVVATLEEVGIVEEGADIDQLCWDRTMLY